ncbi:bone marrow proteoglycan isoform X2 [Alligator sinensis]|nr:bone marrow proteoglycan isoform X2 [Alligator sinensis]XP_025072661.1 bone marrow proteoglycan isoform X2 [Alligator sinensis]XP_025072662.1 bone marrow proteoglycan isoform X2 [Alligator sinensis]
MELLLVLVFALVGAASAGRLSAVQELEVPAKQDSSISGEETALETGDLDPQCPLESESFTVTMAGEGGKTCRYQIVNRCLTFLQAQHVCAHCYRGCLVSVHNAMMNNYLLGLARTYTNSGQVWIGGLCAVSNGRVVSWWMDRSTWNYSHWACGNPTHRCRSCTSLCRNNGQWRALDCNTHLPFICEI